MYVLAVFPDVLPGLFILKWILATIFTQTAFADDRHVTTIDNSNLTGHAKPGDKRIRDNLNTLGSYNEIHRKQQLTETDSYHSIKRRLLHLNDDVDIPEHTSKRNKLNFQTRNEIKRTLSKLNNPHFAAFSKRKILKNISDKATRTKQKDLIPTNVKNKASGIGLNKTSQFLGVTFMGHFSTDTSNFRSQIFKPKKMKRMQTFFNLRKERSVRLKSSHDTYMRNQNFLVFIYRHVPLSNADNFGLYCRGCLKDGNIYSDLCFKGPFMGCPWCDCLNKMDCNSLTAECIEGLCPLGWTGKDCRSNACAQGMFGPYKNCSLKCKSACSQARSEVCHPITGECFSMADSVDAHFCPRGTYDTRCDKVCNCRSKAVCNQTSGWCVNNLCMDDYTGEHCSTMLNGFSKNVYVYVMFGFIFYVFISKIGGHGGDCLQYT